MVAMTARMRISLALLVACFLIVGAILLAPSFAAAQPLVSSCTGINCQLCNLYDLFNRIIQYAILTATIAAAGLFAFAGGLLVTSGGSLERVAKARNIFGRTFFGFTIALVAFLGIETFVNSLAQGKVTFKSAPCVNNRIVEGTGLRFGGTNAVGAIDTATELGTFTGETAALGGGPCEVSKLQAAGVAQATRMSCICAMESGSQPGQESGTDRLKNDPQNRPFSFGLFQINITANYLTDCATKQKVDCPAAFNQGKTSYEATVKDEALYKRCVEIAKDAVCNIENARRLAQDTPQGLGHWGNKRNAAACGIPNTF
jgi:hypothetical protein